MTRGFSDDERDRIRARLREVGREEFSRSGLDRTTIADLTEPVGIAAGTFYRFYDSKADLYVEILEREGETIVPELVAPLEDHDDPERAIAAFLRGLFDEIETNPLIRRLLVDPDDVALLRSHLGDAGLRADREESLAYLLPFVETWFERGELVGPDPRTVASAIRAVSFLTLHREDIGEELYDDTRDLVIDAIARGLVAE